MRVYNCFVFYKMLCISLIEIFEFSFCSVLVVSYVLISSLLFPFLLCWVVPPVSSCSVSLTCCSCVSNDLHLPCGSFYRTPICVSSYTCFISLTLPAVLIKVPYQSERVTVQLLHLLAHWRVCSKLNGTEPQYSIFLKFDLCLPVISCLSKTTCFSREYRNPQTENNAVLIRWEAFRKNCTTSFCSKGCR